MASTWTAKLNWDDVSYANPQPGNPDTFGARFHVSLKAIVLPPGDPLPQYHTTPDYGHFLLSIGVVPGVGGTAGVQYRFGDAEINADYWSSHFLTPAVSGLLPADFLLGGTLSVTKDYDNDLLTFEVLGPTLTSIALFSVALTALDATTGLGYYNPHPLVAHGYQAHFTVGQPTVLWPVVDHFYRAKFHTIVQEENALVYQSILLSAADPGTWWPEEAITFNTISGIVTRYIGSDGPWWTWTQETSRQSLAGVVDDADPGYPLVPTTFHYWRNLQMPGGEVDMIHVPEHGMHLVAEVMDDPETLTWMRTHDKGITWTAGMIYHQAGSTNTSPSITWKMGRINVVWHDGTDILQSFSLDLGISWSTPVPLSITGTNPRHLVDPATGFSWYFYCAGGDLKVKRSGDLGVSFIGSPITVATPVTPQTVTAQLAFDGGLVVGYIAAGAWVQWRSIDLGCSWG